MSEKYCIDCRHGRVPGWFGRHVLLREAMCRHPKAAYIPGVADLVTGEQPSVCRRGCSEMRGGWTTSECGPGAALFEPKEAEE